MSDSKDFVEVESQVKMMLGVLEAADDIDPEEDYQELLTEFFEICVSSAEGRQLFVDQPEDNKRKIWNSLGLMSKKSGEEIALQFNRLSEGDRLMRIAENWARHHLDHQGRSILLAEGMLKTNDEEEKEAVRKRLDVLKSKVEYTKKSKQMRSDAIKRDQEEGVGLFKTALGL